MPLFKHKYPVIVLSGSFMALIMLMMFALLQFKEYASQTRYVEHSYQVLHTLELFKESFVAEAMFRRGYSIHPTLHGQQKVEESRSLTFYALDKLAGLVSDNPDQTRKVQALRQLVNSPKMNISKWPKYQLIQDSAQRMQVIREDIIHNIVYQEFDSVYLVMNNIVTEEDMLFEQRAAIQQKSARNTPILFSSLTLVALLLLLFSFLRMQKELTRRVSMQHQLEKMVQDLQQKNREQERFAFVSSHHLREPIRKSMLFLSRLAHQQSLPPDQANLLERAVSNLSVLDHLTQDLSLYSSTLSEKSAAEIVDLNLIWKQAQGDLQTESTKRNAVIQTATTLPSIAGYGDKIRYVLRELLSNALKFHQPGQHPFIELSAVFDAPAQAWLVQFKDNGIGFDQQHAERIFNVFEQLHAPDQYEGTGMGLALCQRIMQMHQGRITAQSVENQGTVFTLHFPAQA